TGLPAFSFQGVLSCLSAFDLTHTHLSQFLYPPNCFSYKIATAMFATNSSSPSLSSAQESDISPQDLQALKDYLRQDCTPVYGTSKHIETCSTTPNLAATHPVEEKIKPGPLKTAAKRAPKATTNNTTKVTKKRQATTKKTQRQRKTSLTSVASPQQSTPPQHRSIEELLAANFYSLNKQEKTRVLLPMLRNIDPHILEPSLVELLRVQAECTDQVTG
ncbi:hypothetical protein C7974DRAFT_457430, partial [Boeremia exigua]|uniref:uncharacterized protein n=1 Tax=Boeremia exigua TaxID=749465 RepID=UPI001E8DED95